MSLKNSSEREETKTIDRTTNKTTEKLEEKEKTEMVNDKSTDEAIKIIGKGESIVSMFRRFRYVFCVLLPCLLFFAYQSVLSSPRYESRAQLIVQQPGGAPVLDPALAMISGLTGGANTNDVLLVQAYVLSQDMLNYLDEEGQLRQHYTDLNIDFFSRLSSDASKEDFLEFYQSHVRVEVDQLSGVITLGVQGFSPIYAKELTELIVKRSEWYINSIGHKLAEAQLAFAQSEHVKVEEKLQAAKKAVLLFQDQHNILDPLAEGSAIQQITYAIESQIAMKEAELKGLLQTMTTTAPQVQLLQQELSALRAQLQSQRSRLSYRHMGDHSISSNIEPNASQTMILKNQSNGISISELLSQYTELKIELDLSLEGFKASALSLETSRVEAYRQIKYLVTVESPTYPEEHSFPEVFYNLILMLVVLSASYGVISVIVASIKELG